MAQPEVHALGQVALPSPEPKSPWQRLTRFFWGLIAKLSDNSEVPLAANSPLGRALERLRKTFVGVFVLSIGTNLLMLTAPMYMLQLYDRVLSSRSMAATRSRSRLPAGMNRQKATIASDRAPTPRICQPYFSGCTKKSPTQPHRPTNS